MRRDAATVNFYADTGLDRMAQRRGDADWVRGLLAAGEARIAPVWRGRSLIAPGSEPQPAWIPAAAAAPLFAAGRAAIFLGLREGAAYFTADLSELDDPLAAAGIGGRGRFVDLRQVGALLAHRDGALLAYARALVHWHRTHRFCGRCGSATEMREAGHLRVCTDAACGASHFPRTDPAVIMLVSRGEKVLLGRKREWPEGRYSVLAGFVEPGETLEGAVAREVMEETGIAVADIRYHSSQPWPFPASLMLGFTAVALSEEIRFDANELEDARWFDRAELVDGGPAAAARPRSDSIARRLITDWLATGGA